MTIQSFISHLKTRGLTPRREGRNYRAFCPAHPDQGGRPSLTIRAGDDGRILLKCFSGCLPENIVTALGLTMQDLFSGNGQVKRREPALKKSLKRIYRTVNDAGNAIAKQLGGQFTSFWGYQDSEGRESFYVLRFDGCKKLQGDKSYRPIHPVGNDYMDGDPQGMLPLYRLPQLMADRDGLVFVTEGEKAADAACSIGLLATCSAHGAKSASKSDWRPLSGRNVVILPDSDPAGEEYAADVRGILLNFEPPAKVRIVRLSGLPVHGDIADFVDGRDAAEPEALRIQVLTLAENVAPETKTDASRRVIQPIFVRLSDVQAAAIHWLWRGRFPTAMLSLLVGMEGSGKTFLGLYMAARISTGEPWPDVQGSEDIPTPGNVILMVSEDHLAHTIRPRLDAAHADSRRIFALEGVRSSHGVEFFDVLRHLSSLEDMIRKVGDVHLVLIDPLTAYLGKTDQNANAEVRAALGRLSDMAQRHGCAVVGISHFGKNTDRKAVHRTLGSVAFSATARAIWIVTADEEDPERRLFIPTKMNIAQPAKGMAYRIKDMAVAWDPGLFDGNADEILGTTRRSPALTRARHWLQGLLARGPIPQAEVQRLAAQAKPKIAERTLDRAKHSLGVKSVKEGIGDDGKWIWNPLDAPAGSAAEEGGEA